MRDRCCRDGQRPRIEGYLAGADSDVLPRLGEELIRIELEWRFRGDQPPTLSEYQERFPAYAAMLPQWLDEARVAVTELERSDSSPSGASQATPSPDLPTTSDMLVALAFHPRYRVVKTLGRGGMGTVYLAEHKVMKRPVALKVI